MNWAQRQERSYWKGSCGYIKAKMKLDALFLLLFKIKKVQFLEIFLKVHGKIKKRKEKLSLILLLWAKTYQCGPILWACFRGLCLRRHLIQYNKFFTYHCSGTFSHISIYCSAFNGFQFFIEFPVWIFKNTITQILFQVSWFYSP